MWSQYQNQEKTHLTLQTIAPFCRSATKFGKIRSLANRHLLPVFRELWSLRGPVIPCGDMACISHSQYTCKVVFPHNFPMFADSFSVLSIYYVAQGLCASFLYKCPASRGGSLQQHGLLGAQSVAILYNRERAALFPLISRRTPSHGGSGPHLTHDSLGPSQPTFQTASRSVQPFFAQMIAVAECPYKLLYNGIRPYPSKLRLPIPMCGCGSHLIGLHLRPTRVLNTKGISIASAGFEGSLV